MSTHTTAPKTLSVLSLVLGIASFVLFLIFILTMAGPATLLSGGIAGVLGIILGAVALAKRHTKSLALIGIVLSAVAVLASLAVFIFALIFVGALTM